MIIYSKWVSDRVVKQEVYIRIFLQLTEPTDRYIVYPNRTDVLWAVGTVHSATEW